MGKLVLEVVGAAVGAYLGGPQGAAVGFELGAVAGGLIFPNKINAPSVPPTLMQRSAYGSMLPIGKGVFRCAGNVIWEGGITAQQSQSSQGKGGQTVTTTSYFATFACSICDCAATGPIGGIRRIWMNGQIVYDVSANATGATLGASATFARNNMVVYLGSGSQTVDPTMQAALGVGNTSAYRFTAYVVFINVPLQAFGNTIPVVNFEVVTSAVGGLSQLFEVAMSSPTWTTGTNFYSSTTVDTPIILGVSPSIQVIDRLFAAGSAAGSVGDGLVYTYSLSGGAATGSSAQTNYPTAFQGWSLWSDNWAAVGKDHGGGSYTRPYYIMCTSDGNHVLYGPDTLALNSGYPNSPAFVAQVWSVCAALTGWTNFHSAYPCADFAHILVMGKTASSGNFPGVWAVVQVTGGAATVTSNGTLTDGQTINSFGANLTGSSTTTGFNNPGGPNGCLQSDLKTIWLVNVYAHAGEILVLQIQGSLIVTLAGQTGTIASPAGTQAFPASHAAAPANTPTSIWADSGFCAIIAGQELTTWSFGSLATVNQITLDQVVTPLVEAVGVAAANLDTTKISSVLVWGALIEGQGQLRRAMESLSPTFWFDMVESDQKLSFRRRSATPVFTIPIDDMGAVENDKPSDNPLTITLVDDLSLPRQVDVAYYNIGADHQIGTQYARRLTSSSTQRTSISAAAVMADQDAANAAAVILWDTQAGRLQFEFETSLKYGQIEPTDIGMLVDAAVSYLVRMVEKHEQGPVIKWKAVGAAPVYNQNVSPGIISPAPQTVATTGQSTLILLDIAPLRDQDGNTGTPYLYVAMSGQDANWRGGSLFKSNDGGASWVLQLSSTQASTIGSTTTALIDWPNLHNEFDECSTVTINLSTPGASLASASALGVLNGANLCLIGKELLQFKNATLVSGTTWTLSGLLRGRFDTWQSTTGHLVGESFVLLSQSTGAAAPLNIETEGTPDIGTARIYQAVTTGQAIGSGQDQTIVSKGDNLVCFPPLWLLAVESGTGSGDILLSWIRSNRITFQWLEGVDVPMSESSEAYTVTIFSDNTFTTVKRTIAVSGAGVQNATYTAAQQTTDFGATQATLYWGVQQISAITGAGDMTKITSVVIVPTYSSVILATSGLVAFWQLNDSIGSGTAHDSGPNAINGTANSVTFGVTGQGGQNAAQFNGTSSYVTFPNSSSITSLTAWSIEGWAYITTLTDACIFSDVYSSSNIMLDLELENDGHGGTSHVPFVGYFNLSGGTGWHFADGSSTLSLNQWVYMVGTWDGTTIKLYVNGSLVGSSTPGVAPPTASGNGFVMGRKYSGTPYLTGSLQYVAIYNRALSATEVSNHYAAI